MTVTQVKLVGSSGDNEKQTPYALFAWLHKRYRFDYDPFASHVNHLCAAYSTLDGTFREGRAYTRQVNRKDGLVQSWRGRRVFWNPPYGRGLMLPAVEKAIMERNSSLISVGLVKWDTSTAAARLLQQWCDVRPLPRIRFGNELSPATFASALVIIRPDVPMAVLR